MSARVSPTDRIRGEIDALFDGSRDLSEVIEDVARLGARLIIQTAVEAEVDVFLGRARYQRAAECPDARAGSPNGFCESTIKTTAGPVTVARPKLRGTTEAFASTLFGTSGCRNVLAKVPAEAQRELRDAYWATFDTEDLIVAGLQPGPGLVAAVQRRIDAFAEKYGRAYPAAVKCLLTDRDQLTSYLRFPVEHHRRIRHSNFIERTFGETRRRVKVIGRLPGEASCLNLVWAVLDRASRGWRGMTMAPTGTRLLNDIRHQLLDSPTPLRPTDTTKITGDETVGAVA